MCGPAAGVAGAAEFNAGAGEVAEEVAVSAAVAAEAEVLVGTTSGTRYMSCAQSGRGTVYDHNGPSYLYACSQMAGSKLGSYSVR
jgi:hypothetical protein